MKIKKKIVYNRIILKISGEFLQGKNLSGIDNKLLDYIIQEIKSILPLGIEIGIVIGGGNLFRGRYCNENNNIKRVLGDQIGMISTIINGLLLYHSIKKKLINVYLMSSLPIQGICKEYNTFKAIDLIKNHIVILAGGIGNPLFTTDTTACLRAIELEADAILKATKVDGVYSKDPINYPNAKFFHTINYDYVIKKRIKIMDNTAFFLANDYNIPIHIFNIQKPGSLYKILTGKIIGTIIKNY
ncbi:UMP kinase [Enterobacteriaceae endosymbiont of Donacia piscatrix]|uniref:UMP kinase n=1 Tax=Enterobacteriaceae endosymbiont of Donacia piscatrix TaxID=2675780 RepID=UPI001448E198|nr:UMP kinase [Enterobacteriaceae endosymbiont of Donacia piscatrix]QJC34902.1 UMP kinase [Enterobacteriaceae endosymbiont of Donacia piscatrix]